MNLDEDIKRKATVRVSRKDLQKLIAENEQMAEQIIALRAELDKLRKEHLPVKPKTEVIPPPPDEEPFPTYDPNIYFDGSNGLGR